MTRTYFAPASRATNEELEAQKALVAREPLLETVADSTTARFLILNNKRQIVSGNMPEAVAGKRHGEAFGCIHSYDGPGGCATGKACKLCGAGQAVAECILEGHQTVREARIVVEPFVGQDYEVTASPFHIGGEPFALVFFQPLATKSPLSQMIEPAERGQLKPEPAETKVSAIFDDLRAGAGENAVSTSDPGDAVIFVDRKLLGYALGSLVDGAGAVTVAFAEGTDHRTFVVHTDRVISEHEQMRLFESGNPYVAKLLAESVLGARLWVTSSPGEGATFHLSFPASTQSGSR